MPVVPAFVDAVSQTLVLTLVRHPRLRLTCPCHSQEWACQSWFSELTSGVFLVCRATKRRPKEEVEQIAPEPPEAEEILLKWLTGLIDDLLLLASSRELR